VIDGSSPARIARQIDGMGLRQPLPAAQMIVKEQAQPDHPARTQARRMGQHEAQRPDDMRRQTQQPLALDQGLAHQAELAIFEIPETTMDQLGTGGRGGASQIGLFDQHYLKSAPGCVAGDAGTVDAATDDQQIDPLTRAHGNLPVLRLRQDLRLPTNVRNRN